MLMKSQEVNIDVGRTGVKGDLFMPDAGKGLVIFSHGSGSSRKSPRNAFVAEQLHQYDFATLLIDLLTPDEDADYSNRFNIDLITRRLVHITEWTQKYTGLKNLPTGYFGASTGAAAALRAASITGDSIHAIVSRGGRPDLAGQALTVIRAPTLLIVGSLDLPTIEVNRQAFFLLAGEKKLEIVEGASHLFEEDDTLRQVSILAARWFHRYLIRHQK